MPNPKPKPKKEEKYYQTVGRRKTSTAVVRMSESKKPVFVVNGLAVEDYFKDNSLQKTVKNPFSVLGCEGKFSLSVVVKGGGPVAQSEAVRCGISRALVLHNEEFRKPLKDIGFLTRDPRMRESKKPGLKRARRAPQWRKR